MLRALIENCAPGTGSYNVSSLVTDILPILLDKLGDSNRGIRHSSSDTILWLAQRREVDMVGMLLAFCDPVDTQTAWRPVLGRLQLLESLIPQFGVSEGGERGFQLETLMRLVGSAFDCANAEVRSQAIKVTILLFNTVCLQQGKHALQLHHLREPHMGVLGMHIWTQLHMKLSAGLCSAYSMCLAVLWCSPTVAQSILILVIVYVMLTQVWSILCCCLCYASASNCSTCIISLGSRLMLAGIDPFID